VSAEWATRHAAMCGNNSAARRRCFLVGDVRARRVAALEGEAPYLGVA